MGNDECNIDGLEFENLEILKNEAKKDEEAVAFSSKIVVFLGEVMKAHNSNNPPKKVSLTELKKVYSLAGKNCISARLAGKTCGQWALARVNMFLRLKLGEKMEISKGKTKIGTLIDISETWTPSEKDFITADESIKERELDYDFESSEELYLEDYEKIDLNWE